MSPLCKDVRLVQRVLRQNRLPDLFKTGALQSVRPAYDISNAYHISFPGSQVRGAKTVSKRKVKDITQGVLSASPLPVREHDEAPQYPPLLQGVKNNMVKFNECVLLTRVGNFYELYFEHAEEYGPLLGLKVASKSSPPGPVPMAGFPFWQLDRFLKILVQDLGKYVAIYEQLERESEDLSYERKVNRVVTPGTLIDENFLDPCQNNFLLALDMDVQEMSHLDTTREVEVGLAWLDISTGDFFTQKTTHTLLSALLMRIGPREILVSPGISTVRREELVTAVGHAHDLITPHEASSEFTTMSEWNLLLEAPVSKSAEQTFSLHEKIAGHRLLDYVRTRLHDHKLQLRPPQRKDGNEILSIDRGSLRGLEILETAKDGFGKGSLFHAVRRTVTKGGSRLLRDRLTAPSTSLHEIDHRLELVTTFLDIENLRERVIQCLRRTFDVKRLVQKFALNRGDADDMLCLARAISETSNIHDLLRSALKAGSPTVQQSAIQSMLERFNLQGPAELGQRISEVIDEEGLMEQHRIEENEDAEVASLVQESVAKTAPEDPTVFARKIRPRIRTSAAKAHYEEKEDSWIVRRGATATLDRLHANLEQLKTERMELQHRLRELAGTAKVELKWSPGLGHFCHFTAIKGLDDRLVQKLNAHVVSTSQSTRSLRVPEWSRLGERLAQARLNLRGEESRVFGQLRQQIINNLVFLRRNAAIIDELDVATGFAVLAHEQGWSRPKLNNGLSHKIVGGRHPTVKLGLEEQGRTFVSNDLFLGEHERVWVVTGPNMAGKSTFLRQNALITILAQVGSYVPAEHAEIGLVDQIFSRIGAADDLFRDQSTFMVEMLETAAILRHATARSFVIMDEVGRGTTPEDGTAISFASLHHLYHANKARTLFATHFHALVDMTSDWSDIGRYCTDVREEPSGSFSFVHKLKPGVNRQSHALKVARMAGLPGVALDIARTVQQQLMEQKRMIIASDTNKNEDKQPQALSSAYG